VLDEALEGGVNASLNLDSHAKSSSYLLLGLEVEIDDAAKADSRSSSRSLFVAEVLSGRRRTFSVVRLVVIRTWKNSNTQKIYRGAPVGGFRSLDQELARRRLRTLEAAVSLDGLGKLKSVGLHKLKGDRKGRWAMSVNGRWRVCFTFHDGDAYDVELVDYHRG
jgi:proteic killer suppression protein